MEGSVSAAGGAGQLEVVVEGAGGTGSPGCVGELGNDWVAPVEGRLRICSVPHAESLVDSVLQSLPASM